MRSISRVPRVVNNFLKQSIHRHADAPRIAAIDESHFAESDEGQQRMNGLPDDFSEYSASGEVDAFGGSDVGG